MQIDPAKVEVLKVWYSVFCTLMDSDEYTDRVLLEKLRKLRAELVREIPEVEADMAKHKN